MTCAAACYHLHDLLCRALFQLRHCRAGAQLQADKEVGRAEENALLGSWRWTLLDAGASSGISCMREKLQVSPVEPLADCLQQCKRQGTLLLTSISA